MKKIIGFLCLAVILSGCLSVVRFSKLDSGGYRVWSEEKQEWVFHEYANKCDDFLGKFGLFPTLKMRWQLIKLACYWAPPNKKWNQHLGLPCALIGITPGLIVDIPIDLISLPWDWKYRHNEMDDRWFRELDEERACRSLCINCGKTSDGEFSRCKKRSENNTANWNKYYGVCPDCIEAVKTNGYYFVEW